MTKKFFLLIVIFIFTTSVVPTQGDETSPWKEQLLEMGYLLIYNSSINVINGLNLTKEQSMALCELAAEVEKNDTMSHPQKLNKDVEKVCEAYKKLANVLLRQEKILDDVHKKIIEARTIESKIIREGLTYPRKAYKKGDCQRCHLDPGEKSEGKWQDMMKKPEFISEMNDAHSLGVIGNKLTFHIWTKLKKVDSILTDTQKKVFDHFTCCLIPPQEMSDPVRVGQASFPNWMLDLLQKARQTPDEQWKSTKKIIFGYLEKISEIKNPGITDAQKREMVERVDSTLEKARTLSDVDFEMQKEDLCKQLEGEKDDQSSQSTKTEMFKRAFFLLIPGSVKAYNELIKRLEEDEKTKPATEIGKEREAPHSS